MTNKKIKNIKHSKPWITPEIKTLINKKNMLFRKHKKTLNPFDHLSYKTFRNKLNKIIQFHKRDQYNNIFTNSQSNPKDTWKHINSLTNPNKKKKKIILFSK